MDIITIVEKYVELSARRDNLKNTIENSKRDYANAKIEGDMAFYVGDYQSDIIHSISAREHLETQKSAEKDLAQVEQLLLFTFQTYTKAVQSLDEIELKEASITMSAKKADVERKIEELSERRKWAISKGDVAYSNQNNEEVQEYNHISTDCFLEIERIKPTLVYYQYFIKDLNYRANKKLDEDFQPTGSVRK